MFNKKKKRIKALEEIIILKNDIIQQQVCEINELNIIKSKFEKLIDTQAKEIEELKTCFKPLTTMCEEKVEKPKKTPKKTSKTSKKA